MAEYTENPARRQSSITWNVKMGTPTPVARPFSGVLPRIQQPPPGVNFDLEEALFLLAALEDIRDVLIQTDHFSVLSQVEDQIQIVSRKLGLDQGGPGVH